MNYWTYTTTYKDLEIKYIYTHGTSTNKGSEKTIPTIRMPPKTRKVTIKTLFFTCLALQKNIFIHE